MYVRNINMTLDDLISRQAAIDSQIKMVAQGLDWVPVYHLEQLPSAERRGRWIDLKCDQCGQVDMSKPNYCPNCGAKMECEEE